MRPIYSFLKISSQKGHYVHGKSTTVMVESDAKALRRYGLTRALYVDHNPNKLTTVVVSWGRPSLDLWHCLGGLLSSDCGHDGYHGHDQLQILQIFTKSYKFQLFHSIEQLYFCNTKLVFKCESYQENAHKMTQNITQKIVYQLYWSCYLFWLIDSLTYLKALLWNKSFIKAF